MSENRAYGLVVVAMVVAEIAIILGLGSTGASDETIASALVLVFVLLSLVGSFVLAHYASPPDRRR